MHIIELYIEICFCQICIRLELIAKYSYFYHLQCVVAPNNINETYPR